MSLEFRLGQEEDLLTVDASGRWELAEARELIDNVARESRRRGCRRVLIDAIKIDIEGRVLHFERYLMGGDIAARFQDVRLAVLFPEEQINKFTESVVRGAGIDMLVTSDREEALRWLS